MILLSLTATARGQSLPATSDLHLIEDGEEVTWPLSGSAQSTEATVDLLLQFYSSTGYLYAVIDSVDLRDGVRTFFSTPGSQLEVESVDVRVDSDRDTATFERTMRTRVGRTFVPVDLERDIEDLLEFLTLNGAVLSTISVDSLAVDESSMSVRIVLAAQQTRPRKLNRIELNDDTRNTTRLVSRIAELRPGEVLNNYDSDRIRDRLSATTFIDNVGEPELRLDESGELIMFIPVDDAPPGSFDLVLGYLPSTGSGSGGTIVGNGRLELVNIFGGGRTFSLRLNRLPGQVASVEVHGDDPFVAGTPVGLGLSFDGYQQDSTYSRQAFGVQASYLVATGLRLTTSLSREATRPGQAGLNISAGTQRIPRSNTVFLGVGVEYRNVDYAPNPRSGFVLEMDLERGRSIREALRVVESDTINQLVNLSQQRLRATSRFIIPSLPRQAIVLGADARIIVSDEYRENDLFRYGGAASLRGYNEQQFEGRFVGRLLGEYRYQIDRGSYAYLFTDVGFVETAPIDGVLQNRTVHPGFGVGIVFETPLGHVNAAYAMNNVDGPANGRVHIGLSFGL